MPYEGPGCIIKLSTGSGQPQVVGKYDRAWHGKVEPAFDGVIQHPLEGHSLKCQHSSVDDGALASVEWAHPHDRDASSSWNTSVVLARHGDVVEMALVVRVATVQMVMRPVEFALGRPRVLTEVLSEYRVSHGDQELSRSVLRLATAEVEHFVENVLLSPSRVAPVLLISPDAWTERPVIDAEVVFDRIREFAHVAVMETKWAAFKLTDCLERKLSCFDGAVRIYWPGFRRNAARFDHPLYLKSSFHPDGDRSEAFGHRMFRLLASISAFRFVEGTATKAVRKSIAESHRADLIRLRDAARSGTAAKAQLEDELLEALVQIETLQAERDQLVLELEAQKAACAEFQRFAASSGDESADDGEAAETGAGAGESYVSVADAYAAAKRDFSGPLLFLDSAERSAADSPFKNPQRVYELFEALHLVSREWQNNKGVLGQSWNDALRDLGFDFRDRISDTSKGKWRAEYEFQYKGQTRLFERHVTIGAKQANKCLSVHLFRDDDDLVLVVGHCGRHLSNTRT